MLRCAMGTIGEADSVESFEFTRMLIKPRALHRRRRVKVAFGEGEVKWMRWPDLVVLSVDITQRARAAQFEAARTFVNRLGAPALTVPGNHDIALFIIFERLFYPCAAYCRTFGGQMAPVFESPELLVIGVKTTRAHLLKCGEVSDAQIETVAQLLERASAGQFRVVVHQRIAVMSSFESRNLLRGHSAAGQRWPAAGVDVVMGAYSFALCAAAPKRADDRRGLCRPAPPFPISG